MPRNSDDNTRSAGHILVVDDEPVQRKLMVRWLEQEHFIVESVESGQECVHALHRFPAEVVLLDFHMPGMSGLETLKKIAHSHPHLPVIMITYEQSPEAIVGTMQQGAYDYLPKPVDRLRLRTIIPHALERYRLAMAQAQHVQIQSQPGRYGAIISNAESMQPVFGYMERLAHSDISVLIHGESGTGKELVSQEIHARSARASQGEMIAVNCGAISASLQESLLFGHEKGAFTGAQAMHKGFIEQADGGTLFLDEVAELSMSLQTSLLRVLQESKVQRIGSTQPIDVDIRLIAASHKSLRAEVEAGRFREDLYYRLAIFELEIPPLRDRKEDIPTLIHHFMAMYSSERALPITEIDDRALRMLISHPWPGNVRELRNTIERAVLLTDADTLRPDALPPQLHETTPTDQSAQPFESEQVIPLSELERRAILHACKVTQGNMTRASELLGISRATLYRKLSQYNLAP